MRLRSHWCSTSHGPLQTPSALLAGGPGSPRAGKQKRMWFLQRKLCLCTVTSLGCVAHFALLVTWGVFMT